MKASARFITATDATRINPHNDFVCPNGKAYNACYPCFFKKVWLDKQMILRYYIICLILGLSTISKQGVSASFA